MKGTISAPFIVSTNPLIMLPPTTGSSGNFWGMERIVDAISDEYGSIGIRVDSGHLTRICRPPDGSYRGYYVYDSGNPPPYPVTKVNGKTGAVVLTAENVGAATCEPITNSAYGLIGVGETRSLGRSILTADVITARMNYMGVIGTVYGGNPARISFTAFSVISSGLQIDTAIFTIAADGLAITLESLDRYTVAKSSGAIAHSNPANMSFGNIIGIY